MWSFRRLSIWSEPRKLKLRSFSVPRKDQMSSHKNAPLTPKGREAMVRCVETGLSNARRRAVQHHAEDGAPNGSNGRTICATFWPRLHRCPRAAAWPSADAGSRTPAHISSSVIAFEEASLLMPVYRWVASRSRMICGGITWTTPGTASGASHHCTALCRYQGIP